MINGISWLVVTKLDVLDHLTEIPVCVGYKVDGKETDEVPAQACGYEKLECIYRNMPGWASPTQAIRTVEALPKAAREYLAFIEKETGARVGMISTGPDREQTILVPEFVSELGLRKLLNNSGSYQGIALAVPSVFGIRSPFRGWNSQ